MSENKLKIFPKSYIVNENIVNVERGNNTVRIDVIEALMIY